MTTLKEYTDLVNRLRGIYTIPVNDGAGPLNGKDTVTRTFGNLPPIMGEAADAIETLEARLSETQLRNRPMTEREVQQLQDDVWTEYIKAGWKGSYLTLLVNAARLWTPPLPEAPKEKTK